jgi:hypothetical protein
MYWTLDQWQWAPFAVNERGEGLGPSCWKPPSGAHTALDLRTFAECGTPGQVGVPGRYGVFVSNDAPVTGTILSDDPRGMLTTKAKRTVFETLGVQVAAVTLDEYLWELLNVHADDVRICKPLIMKTGMELALRVGPLVKRLQTGKGGPGWNNLQAELQRQYRQAVARRGTHISPTGEVLNGKMIVAPDPDFPERLLSKWVESYNGGDFLDFIPPDLPVREPRPHRTTYTEDFNGADKAGIGYDLTWTETSGDHFHNLASKAESLGTGFTQIDARAESDLSGADHYVQAVITSFATNNYPGVAARFSASARTYYCNDRDVGGDPTYWYLRKSVAGTPTTLATSTSTAPTSGSTMKLSVNGSSLDSLENGASRLTVTDTAITGNTRCGIMGFPFVTADTWDDWEAADLAAGVTVAQTSPAFAGQLERGVMVGRVYR